MQWWNQLQVTFILDMYFVNDYITVYGHNGYETYEIPE